MREENTIIRYLIPFSCFLQLLKNTIKKILSNNLIE